MMVMVWFQKIEEKKISHYWEYCTIEERSAPILKGKVRCSFSLNGQWSSIHGHTQKEEPSLHMAERALAWELRDLVYDLVSEVHYLNFELHKVIFISISFLISKMSMQGSL